ncbi:MAG: DNA polymerase III subunit delta [Phycisphaerales bacterium]|nr:DNA polymerase III subunit delta [Phycisphaerales bacterium]
MPSRNPSSTDRLPLVFAVCGPETFLKLQAINEITDRVLGGMDRGLALCEHEGPTAKLADVLDDLRTLPFLSERRLVLLRDADDFISRYRGQLETYLENPTPTGVLLMECGTFPATTRLYKRVKAVGEVVKCDPVKAKEVPAWLSKRSRQAYGLQLDPRAATMLGELVGTELGRLDCELQKLALYVGERKRIEASDVETLVGFHKEEKVWGIITAIAAGDQAGAMRLWEDVWQTDKAAPGRAVAGIALTVRRLLAALRAQEAGASITQLASILWTNAQSVRKDLAAFSMQQVEEMLCQLLEIDLAGKTGQGNVHSGVEAFILRNCAARQNRRATG